MHSSGRGNGWNGRRQNISQYETLFSISVGPLFLLSLTVCAAFQCLCLMRLRQFEATAPPFEARGNDTFVQGGDYSHTQATESVSDQYNGAVLRAPGRVSRANRGRMLLEQQSANSEGVSLELPPLILEGSSGDQLWRPPVLLEDALNPAAAVSTPLRRELPHSNLSFTHAIVNYTDRDTGQHTLITFPALPPEQASSGNIDVPDAAEAARAAASSSLRAEDADDSSGDGFDGRYSNGHAYTQQTCYEDGDESEMCVYDGVICFDGTSPVMSVAHEPSLHGQPAVDSLNDCADYRFLEPAQYEFFGCAYANGGPRHYRPAAHPEDIAHDWALTSQVRFWGPHNRHHLFFREVHSSDLFPPDRVTVMAEPFQRQAIAGARIGMRTFSPSKNMTIDWLEEGQGGMFIASLPGQAAYNPFHFWAALPGPLFAAQRNNASGPWGSNPRDGYFHDLNLTAEDIVLPPPMAADGSDDALASPSSRRTTARGVPATEEMSRIVWGYRDGNPTRNRWRWRVGPQWKLPRIGVVIAAGDGGAEVPDVTGLSSWYANTLSIATPPGAHVYFNNLLKSYNRNHLLCARRGIVPSAKPKLFSTPSDAWMFRQRAHMHVGLDPAAVPSHPRFPPRTITLLDRGGMHGRSIFNRAWLLATLNATGLPVTVVDRMDALSFAEQVALMAGTGLLVSVHGAALANIMFLPARAAVMELFSPLMYKNTYQYLAANANLHYFPVHSRHLLPVQTGRVANMTDSLDPAFVQAGSISNRSSSSGSGNNLTINNAEVSWRFFGEEVMASKEFRDECVTTNISGWEAVVAPFCNWAAKTYPVLVPRRQFREALRDALDAIGAYTTLNPAWAARADAEGVPVPRFDSDDGELEESYGQAANNGDETASSEGSEGDSTTTTGYGSELAPEWLIGRFEDQVAEGTSNNNNGDSPQFGSGLENGLLTRDAVLGEGQRRRIAAMSAELNSDRRRRWVQSTLSGWEEEEVRQDL